MAKQSAKLVAKYVRRVNSRADAEALPAAERKQFAVAAAGIVGGTTLEETYQELGDSMMGLYKLQLFRGTKHVYDLWINTVLDDGSVMLPRSAKHAGIGISQTRVYGHDRPREQECAEIYDAIYRGKIKYPKFVEAGEWT